MVPQDHRRCFPILPIRPSHRQGKVVSRRSSDLAGGKENYTSVDCWARRAARENLHSVLQYRCRTRVARLQSKSVVIEGSTVYSPNALAPLYAAMIGYEVSAADIYALAARIGVKYGQDS